MVVVANLNLGLLVTLAVQVLLFLLLCPLQIMALLAVEAVEAAVAGVLMQGIGMAVVAVVAVRPMQLEVPQVLVQARVLVEPALAQLLRYQLVVAVAEALLLPVAVEVIGALLEQPVLLVAKEVVVPLVLLVTIFPVTHTSIGWLQEHGWAAPHNGGMKLIRSPSSLLPMPVSLLLSRGASCTKTQKRLSWRSRRLLMRSLQMSKQSEDSGQSSSGQKPNQPRPSLWRKRKPMLPLTKPKSWQTSLPSLLNFSDCKNSLQNT
jgi:hypothetical protein